MKKTLKLLCIIVCFNISTAAFSQNSHWGFESPPPHHHYTQKIKREKPLVHFKNSFLFLRAPDGPVVFQLHNKGSQDVIVDYAKHNGTAQAGLASQIDIDKHSALWHSHGTLKLACYKTNATKRVSCAQALDVMTVPQTNSTHDMGDYWVAENMSKPLMCSKMAARGVTSECQMLSNAH